MTRPDAADPPSHGPTADPCSRCGQPVARVPLLYVGKDLANDGISRVLCRSCLDRMGRGRRIGGFLGGLYDLLDFFESYLWIVWVIILVILAALIRSFGNR